MDMNHPALVFAADSVRNIASIDEAPDAEYQAVRNAFWTVFDIIEHDVQPRESE